MAKKKPPCRAEGCGPQPGRGARPENFILFG